MSERLAQGGEGLAQAVPRLGLGPIAPEQAGQPLAALRLAVREGEIGEQDPVLAGRQRHVRAVAGRKGKAAQDCQPA